MNKNKVVKISVIRIADYKDLQELYENKIEHACSLKLNDVFYSIDGRKPSGLCGEAWKTLAPFVKKLVLGESNFYDGWMKNPFSACLSCNDGFRPVSFLIELIKEEEK